MKEIIQLCMFPDEKGSFKYEEFENDLSPEIHERIKKGIQDGWETFTHQNLEGLDISTRAAMLNNWITYNVENQIQDIPSVVSSKIHGDRRRTFIYGKYIFIFKKWPVRNSESNFVREIKSQNLNKHVITVSYIVDPTWTDLTSIDFQYLENDEVIYSMPVFGKDEKHIYLTDTVEEEVYVNPELKVRLKTKKAE